jgi:tripartite-type tricarboxylate transporter receptor subunit TctC
MRRLLHSLGFIAMLATLAAPLAHAQDYPAKPLTIVVPFAAGSGTDQMARAMGQALTEATKLPVIVDNKPGANGFIASQYVARAAPDGYTMLMTTNTTPRQRAPAKAAVRPGEGLHPIS